MKDNLRKLNLIFRFTKLKPGMFYSVSFTETGVNMQGHFKGLTAAMLKQMLFDDGVDKEYGYVTFVRSNIIVTLT